MFHLLQGRNIFIALFLFACLAANTQQDKPLRIGVAGLTHSHVNWIFNSAKNGDIEIAGIAEPNKELAARYAKQFSFPPAKIYSTLNEMMNKEKPEAVAAFNSIYEHLEVVEQCAPRGIHVMVEKPLAVSLEHAIKMEALAKKHNIVLLTNYETTWYSSVHQAYKMINVAPSIGAIKKLVVHDGHQGPKEIGVQKEFLDWLTDPQKNGAGALIDFGCYGADLSTWLMKGQRPVSVTAVIQQLKPAVYPKVDDEATIILAYPSSQTIIQASWNWPFARKDMEVYGQTGIIVAKNKSSISYRFAERNSDSVLHLPDRKVPYNDPFSFFKAVVRKTVKLEDNDLSSLPLNMVVMEILEAAKRSAKEGKTVYMEGFK